MESLILEVGNQGMGVEWGEVDVFQRATLSQQSGYKTFYQQREGVTHRNSTVSSDSHQEIGHWWSDPCNLDCFSTANLQFQGWFVSLYLRPILRTVAACHGYKMAIVWFTSPPGVSVSIRQVTGRAQTIVYSPWEGAEGPWLCLR